MSPISRRALLGGAGLAGAGLIAAAGIGSAVAAIIDLPRRSSPAVVPSSPSPTETPPAQLVAALAREGQLLAGIGAALAADPANPILLAVRNDHRAHADAIALAAAIPAPAAGSNTAAPAPAVAALKAAETAAQMAAATDAARLRGSNPAGAVLLASIAACEAGHAELLT
jgi:hypothetical protein